MKNHKDRAASTLVTGIISMTFICMCLAFALDISKNVYLKGTLASMSQRSVQSAVKYVDSRGSLNENAVKKVVREYQAQSYSSYYNPDLVGGEQERYDETANYKSEECSVRNVVRYGDTSESLAKMPYMVIKLEPERKYGSTQGNNVVVYVSEGGGEPVQVSGMYNYSLKYKVISASVHDSSLNFMLGWFGMPCQDYNPKVSAITFGSNTDVE